MEIETVKQVDEKSLRVDGIVDIDIRTSGDNVYVRLFSRYEQKGWLILRDMAGTEHIIDINVANTIILEQILSNEVVARTISS